MKRIDRLKEIEKLWKSKPRETDWKHLEWESKRSGRPVTKSISGLVDELREEVDLQGYYFHSGGLVKEAPSHYRDWLLLHHLHAWYSLPEDWDVPMFVNEKAMVFCVPSPDWADSLALLFQHPDAVLLGMGNLVVEKEAEIAAEKAELVMNRKANKLECDAALAFLRQGEDNK